MKKVFLIIFTTFLLSLNSNCQWYQRQYGVNELSLLSKEQLNEAVVKCNTGLVFGAVFSIAAATGIVSGIIMTHAPYPESMGKGFAGVAWIMLCTPPEIVGLTLLGVYSTRKKSIKEVLNNKEIKIGFINYTTGNLFTGSSGNCMSGLSISIRF